MKQDITKGAIEITINTETLKKEIEEYGLENIKQHYRDTIDEWIEISRKEIL